MSMQGQRVLITGAAGGLGPSVIAAAADAGARLVLVDVSQERLDELTAKFSTAVESTHVVDLLDPEAVDSLAQAVTTEPLDAVWHLVGGWRGGKPVDEQPLEDWKWLNDLLVSTTAFVVRSFTQALKASPQGRFAIISAKQAQQPTSKNAAYAAAKAASEAVVLALADEFDGTPATANIVVVPAIVTPAMREQSPDKDWSNFVPAEQIADALVFLSSPAAAKMNGQRVRLYSGGPS